MATNSRQRKRRLSAIKLSIGLGVLSIGAVVSLIAGVSELRSLGEGDGLSVAEEYMAGSGITYSNEQGRFRAEIPSEASEIRTDKMNLFDGSVKIQGIRSKLGDADSTFVHVSWFDLPEAPAASDAVGLLGALALFRSQLFGSTPADGHVVDGSDEKSYEYRIELSPDATLKDAGAEFIVERLVLVGARVYVLWVDSAEPQTAVLSFLASTFEPTSS